MFIKLWKFRRFKNVWHLFVFIPEAPLSDLASLTNIFLYNPTWSAALLYCHKFNTRVLTAASTEKTDNDFKLVQTFLFTFITKVREMSLSGVLLTITQVLRQSFL